MPDLVPAPIPAPRPGMRPRSAVLLQSAGSELRTPALRHLLRGAPEGGSPALCSRFRAHLEMMTSPHATAFSRAVLELAVIPSRSARACFLEKGGYMSCKRP